MSMLLLPPSLSLPRCLLSSPRHIAQSVAEKQLVIGQNMTITIEVFNAGSRCAPVISTTHLIRLARPNLLGIGSESYSEAWVFQSGKERQVFTPPLLPLRSACAPQACDDAVLNACPARSHLVSSGFTLATRSSLLVTPSLPSRAIHPSVSLSTRVFISNQKTAPRARLR